LTPKSSALAALEPVASAYVIDRCLRFVYASLLDQLTRLRDEGRVLYELSQ